MKKRRIKNKAVRRVLRQVAQWDNCPPEYQIDFKQKAIDLIKIICGAFFAMLSFMYLAIYFC